MTEIWRPVLGYEGLYEVSDTGSVMSVAFRNGHVAHRPQRRTMRVQRAPNGYLVVALSRGGSVRTHLVHRLVARAFLGEPPADRPQVAHLNGDKADPRLANLAFVNQRENETHKAVHGTLRHGEQHYATRLTVADVLDIREARATGAALKDLAHHYRHAKETIAAICWGKTWRHVGGPITHRPCCRSAKARP